MNVYRLNAGAITLQKKWAFILGEPSKIRKTTYIKCPPAFTFI